MEIEWFGSERLGEKYCRIRLDGRPDIYVFPKDLSSVFALCAVRYGSVDRDFINENGVLRSMPDGVAHFLEHKMFTQEDGADAFEQFAALGADANAYTSYDRTVYYFNCTDRFDEAFRVLLNMVTHPCFTDESVVKEQGIIAQEIGMKDDDPDDICYHNMLGALYESCPIRVNICGTVGSISEITPLVLYECHDVFYNMSNMVVIVCGRVTPENVARLVSDELKPQKAKKLSRYYRPERQEPYKARAEACMQMSMPEFCIGFKQAPVADPAVRRRRDIALSILEQMLFSVSAELYNELYDRRMITSPLSCWHLCSDGADFCELYGTAEDPDAVCKYIAEHLEKKKRDGLSEADLERCRRIRLADYIACFDSTEEIASLLTGCAFDGLDIFTDLSIISDIRFDEISELLESVFRTGNSAVSIVLPLDRKRNKN